MFILIKPLIVALAGLLLVACSASNTHQDLRDFIAENKRRPPGTIEAAPKLEPYQAFEYDAYSLRSPFDEPVSEAATQQIIASSNNVKPDLLRSKEPLESHPLSGLTMVGSLAKDGILWALVSDPDGSIERVTVGNYMGKDHGRITALTANKIDLIEIVASGDGWLERPNLVQLRVVDGK